jgi:predicted amidohydrolase
MMRIALAQMDIIWEDKQENRQKCEAFISGAKEQNVDLLLFPEMTLTGFSMNVEKIGESSSGKETIDWFKGKAVEFGIHIAFGYVGISEEQSNSLSSKDMWKENKGKNNLCIVSPQGDEMISYTKIHPFSFAGEDEFFVAGNEVITARIDDFCIAPFICYDLRFPEIFQMASKEAELAIVIANWPKARREHWITLLKARAIENQCYVVGVNRVGIGDGIEYSGDSIVVDPNGTIIANAALNKEDEELIIATLDKNIVDTVRRNFPVKKDRREDIY